MTHAVLSYLFLALSICAIAYAVVALARMLAFRARLEAYEKVRINSTPTTATTP